MKLFEIFTLFNLSLRANELCEEPIDRKGGWTRTVKSGFYPILIHSWRSEQGSNQERLAQYDGSGLTIRVPSMSVSCLLSLNGTIDLKMDQICQ